MKTNGTTSPQTETSAAKTSKSRRILDLIAAAGKRGMRYTEIQEALWKMTYPDAPFRVPSTIPYYKGQNSNRGYWSTNLTPLLNYYCTQSKPGAPYVRNRRDHKGEPWRVLRSRRGVRLQYADANRRWEETRLRLANAGKMVYFF